jgi:hypothetical protein
VVVVLLSLLEEPDEVLEEPAAVSAAEQPVELSEDEDPYTY